MSYTITWGDTVAKDFVSDAIRLIKERTGDDPITRLLLMQLEDTVKEHWK